MTVTMIEAEGATVLSPRIVSESPARERGELAERLAAQPPPLSVWGPRRAIGAPWHRRPQVGLRLALEEQIHCS